MKVALTATEIRETLGFMGVAGIGFSMGLLVGTIALVITTTKRWHRKHHKEWSVVCDHCLRERGYQQ